MTSLTNDIIFILALLAIAGQIFILFLVILFFISKESLKNFADLFSERTWLFFAFLLALLSMAGTLYFSEIVGFEPCKLCWFQRIFMYPEVILLGIAVWNKDFGIKPYALTLAGFGVLFSLLHMYEQISGSDLTACAASGAGPSCVKIYFTYFGYITFPVLSLTSFLMIVAFVLFASRDGKRMHFNK
jgi:disulfide bond formation protein DsbB